MMSVAISPRRTSPGMTIIRKSITFPVVGSFFSLKIVLAPFSLANGSSFPGSSAAAPAFANRPTTIRHNPRHVRNPFMHVSPEIIERETINPDGSRRLRRFDALQFQRRNLLRLQIDHADAMRVGVGDVHLVARDAQARRFV